VVSNIAVSRGSKLIFGVGGVLALSVAIFVSKPRFSRSSIQFFGASCPCPTFHEQVTGFIVLNPLRDRGPEKVASRFLADLRNGKCNADERTVPELCKAALERRPVLDLRLRNRKDVGNAVTLFYLFKGKFRPDRDTFPEDAWGEGMVQVEHLGTDWKVTNYGSRY
jgi:hypothetical protein